MTNPIDRRPMRVAVLAALATIAATIGPGQEAIARDGGAKCKIKIAKLTPQLAKGKVTSGANRCEGKGRKISLFRYEDFVTDKIAITYTNGRGRWKVRRPLAPGKYFAKVDHSRGCRYAVSRNKWNR
jgi:hypothetical protein